MLSAEFFLKLVLQCIRYVTCVFACVTTVSEFFGLAAFLYVFGLCFSCMHVFYVFVVAMCCEKMIMIG